VTHASDIDAPAHDAEAIHSDPALETHPVAPCACHVAEELIARAKCECENTDRRLALLGEKLYAGAAWNMLLDLFVSESCAKRLSVSDLCLAARTSSATALRRLTLLEEAGLIVRSPDITDARRFYITLTQTGWSTMFALLGHSANHGG